MTLKSWENSTMLYYIIFLYNYNKIKYIIYQQNFKNMDELMKEKMIFRVSGIIEIYDNLSVKAESDLKETDEKIKSLIREKKKESKMLDIVLKNFLKKMQKA